MRLPYNIESLEWDDDHSRNVQNVYCYCGKGFKEDKPMLQCDSCKQLFHGDCIKCLPKPLLFGDVFATFKCAVCNGGSEKYERDNMSWATVVHLVLYNLMKRQKYTGKKDKGNKHKYFRWKDDICAFIDDYWDYLVPEKKRSVTWHNTIASVLSTHPAIFESGLEKFHQSAWWTLHVEEPPTKAKSKGIPKKSQKRQRSTSEQSENVSTRVKRLKAKPTDKTDQDTSTSTSKPPKVQPSKNKKVAAVTSETPKTSDQLEELIEENDLSDLSSLSDISSDSDLFDKDPEETKAPTSPAKRTTRLAARNEKNKNGIPQDSIPVEKESKPNDLADAPKVTRDGRQRRKSLKESKAEPQAPVKSVVTEAAADTHTDQVQPESSEPTVTQQATAVSETETIPGSQEMGEQKERSIPESDQAKQHVEKKPKQPSRTQASSVSQNGFMSQQEEWSYLQRFNNAARPLPTNVARFARKLATRRLKRSLALKLFDMDSQVLQHLRSKAEIQPMSKKTTIRLASNQQHETPQENAWKKTALDNIQYTPYMSSFASRLFGSARNRHTVTKTEPWLSSWNGRKLRPYIRRDFESKPSRMLMLQQIKRVAGKPRDAKTVPDTRDARDSIDYVYFQREHLQEVNEMLRRCFWDGVDISESLLFPEFSIIALFKRRVIGCALMTPEAYITYIAVLPGWDGAGIGQFMLYHLFQTAISKDITLHVSANNNAMILYQKFGFKPEEFIVNFYDKYLPPDSTYSKNAFFLRLRR